MKSLLAIARHALPMSYYRPFWTLRENKGGDLASGSCFNSLLAMSHPFLSIHLTSYQLRLISKIKNLLCFALLSDHVWILCIQYIYLLAIFIRFGTPSGKEDSSFRIWVAGVVKFCCPSWSLAGDTLFPGQCKLVSWRWIGLVHRRLHRGLPRQTVGSQ